VEPDPSLVGYQLCEPVKLPRVPGHLAMPLVVWSRMTGLHATVHPCSNSSGVQDLGERLDDLAKLDEQVAGTLSSLTGSMTWNIDECIWRIRLNPLRTFEKR
jgi:hypothetical protein